MARKCVRSCQLTCCASTSLTYRLVDQRRGLEAVSCPFAAHAPGGNPMKLLLHQRYELLERGLVAAAPLLQQSRDVHSCHVIPCVRVGGTAFM